MSEPVHEFDGPPRFEFSPPPPPIARALDAAPAPERPLCADFRMGSPCLNLAERGDFCAEHAPAPVPCPNCGEAMDGIQHGRSECNVDTRETPAPPAEVEAALRKWDNEYGGRGGWDELLATVTALVAAERERCASAEYAAEAWRQQYEQAEARAATLRQAPCP